MPNVKRYEADFHYSRISDYQQCPMKFKYKYIDMIGEDKTSVSALRGTVVHKVIELLHIYNFDIPEEVVGTVDSFENGVRKLFRININEEETKCNLTYKSPVDWDNRDQDIQDIINEWAPIIVNYSADPRNRNCRVLHHETKFQVEIKGASKTYNFSGRIDQVREYADPDTGEIETVLVDFKTSKSVPDQDFLDNYLQTSLYAYALKHGVIHVPDNFGIPEFKHVGLKVDRVAWAQLRDYQNYKNTTTKTLDPDKQHPDYQAWLKQHPNFDEATGTVKLIGFKNAEKLNEKNAIENNDDLGVLVKPDVMGPGIYYSTFSYDYMQSMLLDLGRICGAIRRNIFFRNIRTEIMTGASNCALCEFRGHCRADNEPKLASRAEVNKANRLLEEIGL